MRKELHLMLDEWGQAPIPAVKFAEEMKRRRREAERGRRMRHLLTLPQRLTPRPRPNGGEWPKFYIGKHHGERCAILKTESGPITLPFISMQFREVR